MIKIGNIVMFNEENKVHAPDFGFDADNEYEVINKYPLFQSVEIINDFGKLVAFNEHRFNIVK